MTTELPPGPALPAAEQTIQWIGKPYSFLRRCEAEFGDPFTLDFGPDGKWVLFSDPAAIRTIFTAEPEVLHAGKGHAVLRRFLGEGSLLQLEEKRHLRERKLLVPAFHGKRMLDCAGMIQAVAREKARRFVPGRRVVIHDVMQRISLGVVLRAVFGLQTGPRLAELEELLLAFLGDSKFNLALIGRLHEDLSSSAVWKKYWQSFERIDEMVLEQVANRRRAGDDDPRDVLGMLLCARDELGHSMTDAELRDEIVTLLVTGYETTATGLAWAFYWLHRNPASLDRMLAEVAASDAIASPDRFSTLPFLGAVCQETLRIHPVIPLVARQVQRPFLVQGLTIPAGTTVSACIYLTHHRAELYSDPDEFRPERFLERSYSAYEWLPFGGGARRCLAMPLALLGMKIVLGTILSEWHLELETPDKVHPVRRSVSVAPSGGVRMRVREGNGQSGLTS